MAVYLQGIEQVVAHASKHQDTGTDEISVAALSGELADRQKSKAGTSALGWTDEKLLKGAGVGVALDEIDVPTGIGRFVSASETLMASANTFRSTISATYVKLKEIKTNLTGVHRVKFDLCSNGSYLAYGRIYKNGVAFGTEQSHNASETFATFTEDLTFGGGDLIQLYVKVAGGIEGWIQNFRIYGTVYDVSVVID